MCLVQVLLVVNYFGESTINRFEISTNSEPKRFHEIEKHFCSYIFNPPVNCCINQSCFLNYSIRFDYDFILYFLTLLLVINLSKVNKDNLIYVQFQNYI